jgi:molybdopterin-guanine dinucleotide biosynthesis protein A
MVDRRGGGRVVGAVLVGGASSRMGIDKATLEVDGVAMGARVAAALGAAGCAPVVAVGGPVSRGDQLGLEVVVDRWPGEGPLGAIITVLERAAADGVDAVAIAACDLPWLDAATLGSLVERYRLDPTSVDVVVARASHLEPLCAVWACVAAPALRHRFDAGERAVHRALAALRVEAIDVDRRCVVNVNSQADLGAAGLQVDPPNG